MAINSADTLELLARFDYVAEKYVPLAAELAPKIEQFGRYREELQKILVELVNRNVQPETREDLVAIIQGELDKRGKTDEELHQMEGRGTSMADPGQADQ